MRSPRPRDGRLFAIHTDLANRIADDLFRNGAGAEAARLVLELKDTTYGEYGGGWCKQAVVDRIKAILLTATELK